MEMKIVFIHSPLGGSLKTTTAFILSYIYACKLGKTTILIDLDIHASTSAVLFKLYKVSPPPSVYELAEVHAIGDAIDTFKKLLKEGAYSIACEKLHLVPVYVKFRRGRERLDRLLALLGDSSGSRERSGSEVGEAAGYLVSNILDILRAASDAIGELNYIMLDLGTGYSAFVSKLVSMASLMSSWRPKEVFYIEMMRVDDASVMRAEYVLSTMHDTLYTSSHVFTNTGVDVRKGWAAALLPLQQYNLLRLQMGDDRFRENVRRAFARISEIVGRHIEGTMLAGGEPLAVIPYLEELAGLGNHLEKLVELINGIQNYTISTAGGEKSLWKPNDILNLLKSFIEKREYHNVVALEYYLFASYL